jgi:hypothetical protein
MNTELIISRAKELKEFKLDYHFTCIKTKEQRKAILWYFKRECKIEESSEASKEIDSYFGLFIKKFSLDVVMGILHSKYNPYYSFVNELIDDEIKRIKLCTYFRYEDLYLYLEEGLYSYREYIKEQKIKKNSKK